MLSVFQNILFSILSPLFWCVDWSDDLQVPYIYSGKFKSSQNCTVTSLWWCAQMIPCHYSCQAQCFNYKVICGFESHRLIFFALFIVLSPLLWKFYFLVSTLKLTNFHFSFKIHFIVILVGTELSVHLTRHVLASLILLFVVYCRHLLTCFSPWPDYFVTLEHAT